MTPAPRRRRAAVRNGLLLVFAAIALGVGISGCMERLFFYPDRSPFTTPPGVQDVNFTTADGLTLHGWFIPPRGRTPDATPAPAVLHVHGNAGNVSHHLVFCDFLAQEGFAVLLFDYRSYGRSDPGPLRRRRLLADAHAALDTLLARPEIDPSRVAVYGNSLGAVVALALAAERPEPRAVVSAAAFSRWQRVASDHTGLLARALVRHGLDAEVSAAALADRPLLVIHGTADEIVPVYHAERIADSARAAGVPVTVAILDGVDHNDLMVTREAQRAVADFLRRTLAET
ncbi:MAG: alpha/beta fold hydrolase, partial [Phycisphaeraceae bacterium]|nr:alpha/beta fold hydrolase [Phycisphaeraceae bacterium]